MATTNNFLAIAAATAVVWLAFRLRREHTRKRGGLPPGPPTIPILGNLLQIPRSRAHQRFAQWAKECGSDVITVRLGPQVAIVLSSARAIREVLDKQSGSTSDRPSVHINMIVTHDNDVVFARYTERWRRLRKAEHMLLSTSTVHKFVPIQEAESAQLLYELATAPKDFYRHIERYAASAVLSIACGKRSVRYDSALLGEFNRDLHRWMALMDPGNHPPIDMLPFLQKLPEFMASWKTEAREVRGLQRGLFMRLLEECEERVSAGEETPFYMADILKNKESLGLEREQIAYLGGDLFAAGTDTTATTLHVFVWIMVKYPEVQRKAQEEIDRVVGRLPVQQDAEDLPYLQAVIKELHRLYVILPMGVPHAASEDVEYNGYIIPKGALIMQNTYAAYRDEDAFDKPDVFDPERYLLTPHGTKPGYDDSAFRSTLMFGSGRRICPGMHLASNTVMIAAMRLLWTFSFEAAKDASGMDIPLDTSRWKTAFVEGPLPYECSIVPRSAERIADIERAFRVDATPTLKAFEYRLDESDEDWLSHHLPPGPQPAPIVGNMLQLPRHGTHLRFLQWAKQYSSDIITVMMGPQHLFVLSSAEAVKEILDRQSGLTADRPRLRVNDYISGDLSIVFAHYTAKWRRVRKAEHLLLSIGTVRKYIPIQEAESTQLLYNLATTPKDFHRHLERYAGSIVLSITYGRRSVRHNSSVAEAMLPNLHRFDVLVAPVHNFFLDVFPVAWKLPDFLSPWKREAREVGRERRELYMKLLGECEERMAAKEDAAFYMADVSKNQDDLGLEREQVAYLGGDLFGAGMDTASSLLQTLVWVMVTHPKVQKKAQEEIDSVVDGLPGYEDAESLPYVQAMIKEIHRHYVVAPLNAPHAATGDIEYKGYILPKGSVIVGNLYAIYHDEDTFDEPHVFKPERFLLTPFGTKPGVDDSAFRSTLMFGAGRRICPGMHLASNTIMIATMRLLWAFSFEPAKDVAGVDIPLNRSHWKTTFIEGPLPFECSIRPRSEERAKAIEKAFKVDAAPTLKAFEYGLDAQDEEWLKQARGGV
ncbi:cytochrome P450 [Schizophyllum commune]